MLNMLITLMIAISFSLQDDIQRRLVEYYDKIYSIKCKIRIEYGGDIAKIVDDAKQNNKSLQISQGIKIEWVQSGNRILWSKQMDIEQRPRKGLFENGQYKKSQIGGTKEQVHFNSLVVDVANIDDVILDDELSPWLFNGFVVGGAKKHFLSKLFSTHEIQVSRDQTGQIATGMFTLDDTSYKIDFDVPNGFLPKSMITESKDSKNSRFEMIITEWQKVDGIKFPRKIQQTMTAGGMKMSRRIEFSEVAINQPIPVDTFQLNLPKAKTYVLDKQKMETGVLDRKGNIEVGMRPIESSNSKESQRNWIYWISLSLVLIAGFLFFIRRIQKSKK